MSEEFDRFLETDELFALAKDDPEKLDRYQAWANQTIIQQSGNTKMMQALQFRIQRIVNKDMSAMNKAALLSAEMNKSLLRLNQALQEGVPKDKTNVVTFKA